jgi:hypothetical protein
MHKIFSNLRGFKCSYFSIHGNGQIEPEGDSWLYPFGSGSGPCNGVDDGDGIGSNFNLVFGYDICGGNIFGNGNQIYYINLFGEDIA